MKTILLLVVLATRTVFGQVENLRGLDLIDRMLLEKALNDAALNGARKANRELLEQIDGLTFRVEVDATGRPLHLPSEFYTFRAGDPTKYTGDLRKHFAHEILPAQKAKAYQAAWDNYNATQAAQSETDEERAFNAARKASSQTARRLYPDIKDKGSALARKWDAIAQSLPANDPLNSDPDAPLKITIRAAQILGIRPAQ